MAALPPDPLHPKTQQREEKVNMKMHKNNLVKRGFAVLLALALLLLSIPKI